MSRSASAGGRRLNHYQYLPALRRSGIAGGDSRYRGLAWSPSVAPSLLSLALPAPAFRYEIPYGSLERPDDGREYPGQRWVLVAGSDGYGMAIANDAKYSYAAKDDGLFITALRSPVFAHHKPVQLDAATRYTHTDQGAQTFVVRILAGPDAAATAAQRLAGSLMQPFVATPHVARGGTGEHRASLLDLRTESCGATWLKVAEDGSDLVLRVLEHQGRGGTVTLPESGDQFGVHPYGLLSLRRDRHGHWWPCDGRKNHAVVITMEGTPPRGADSPAYPQA